MMTEEVECKDDDLQAPTEDGSNKERDQDDEAEETPPASPRSIREMKRL